MATIFGYCKLSITTELSWKASSPRFFLPHLSPLPSSVLFFFYFCAWLVLIFPILTEILSYSCLDNSIPCKNRPPFKKKHKSILIFVSIVFRVEKFYSDCHLPFSRWVWMSCWNATWKKCSWLVLAFYIWTWWYLF